MDRTHASAVPPKVFLGDEAQPLSPALRHEDSHYGRLDLAASYALLAPDIMRHIVWPSIVLFVAFVLAWAFLSGAL